LDRVRLTTLGASGMGALVFAFGAVPIASPQLRRLRRGHGFELSPTKAGDSAIR
jgi:hypothetical protein